MVEFRAVHERHTEGEVWAGRAFLYCPAHHKPQVAMPVSEEFAHFQMLPAGRLVNSHQYWDCWSVPAAEGWGERREGGRREGRGDRLGSDWARQGDERVSGSPPRKQCVYSVYLCTDGLVRDFEHKRV